ncbi:putative NTPase (NACHT family) [Frankia sp. Hr75.2]|nr:putative NTPase (NACHT family) [Frankia sp. Hr75.2]
MEEPRSRRKGLIYLILTGIYAAVALGVTLYNELNIVAVLGSLAPVVPQLYMSWTEFRYNSPASADPQLLIKISDDLAKAVRAQWVHELNVRRLAVDSLSVKWGPVDHDLVDDWTAIIRLATRGLGWPERDPSHWADGPVNLHGSDNDLIGILERIPTGRLLMLGEPGAGKTVLLVRLVLDLLNRRRAGDPVPILMPLASWNPDEQGLESWFESRLAMDYPALREPVAEGSRLTKGRALIDSGMIFPVLDGLDEISVDARGLAIDCINNGLQPGQRLVISSRAKSYREVTNPQTGTGVRLTGVAGVLLCPLDTNAVAEFLRTSAGNPARWDRVLANPPPPVKDALSTPLMATLARTIYNPRPREGVANLPDPSKLCDPDRFPTKAAVEQYLFDAFISAAYRRHPEYTTPWSAEQADKWLSFLANHLENRLNHRSGLAWWEIHYATPRPLVGLILASVTAFICGPAASIGTDIGIGLGAGLSIGLAVTLSLQRVAGVSDSHSYTRGIAGGLMGGLFGALAAGLAGGFGVGMADSPTGALATGLGVGVGVGTIAGLADGIAGGFAGGLAGGLVSNFGSGAPAGIVNGLGVALAVGLATGMAAQRFPARGLRWSPAGVAGGLTVGLAVGLAVGLTIGVMVGLLVGLTVGILDTLVVGLTEASADLETAASPMTVLVRDRHASVMIGLATGAMSAFVSTIMVGFIVVLENSIQPSFIAVVRHGLGAGLASGSIVGIVVCLLRGAWGSYFLARCWLAFQGRLPWRLAGFLADAHEKRGVLRQSGAIYEFRHLKLQQSLAKRADRVRHRRTGRSSPS